MVHCDSMNERMALLLTESLDAATREQTLQHIEGCAQCSAEWDALRHTWRMMDELPQVEVPARVKQRFLATIGQAETVPVVVPVTVEQPGNVVPFVRRPAFKWVAQAAGVLLIAGGSFFAGKKTDDIKPAATTAPMAATFHEPAKVTGIQPVSFSLAESRVLPAASLDPDIQGRPRITNVQFADPNGTGDVGVSFDMTSRVTVTGNPNDKSLVKLLSYVLQNDDSLSSSRSSAIEWVRRTYSNPSNATPEIADALAKVLRDDDSHEGVRIRAVETLKTMPAPVVVSQTRQALIDALKSDPNPGVRIKAVEALANLARNGETLEPEALETLRVKASQDDENLYVRVKAAEALSSVKSPQ